MNKLTKFIKGIEESKYGDNIEIIGDNRIIVENTQNIIEYTEQTVRLGVGRREIVINGTTLKLNDYSDKNIVVTGKIKNIRFE